MLIPVVGIESDFRQVLSRKYKIGIVAIACPAALSAVSSSGANQHQQRQTRQTTTTAFARICHYFLSAVPPIATTPAIEPHHRFLPAILSPVIPNSFPIAKFSRTPVTGKPYNILAQRPISKGNPPDLRKTALAGFNPSVA